MNKNKGNNNDPLPPSTYRFYLGSRERYIHIWADFEAGNIQLVRQLSEFNYRLSCLDDAIKTQHAANSKSWFYFAARGFPKSTKVKFAITRLQTLLAVYHSAPNSYRPVFRERLQPEGEWSEWTRVSGECPLILRENGELQCQFEFPFRHEQHTAEFAFAFPYSFSRNEEYLNALNEYYCHDEFYFHKEVLTRSPEGRNVHLLTITSHDQTDDHQEEELFNEGLFPQRCRPRKFKKPVILITGRVHPGETAASFAMEGIIDFLVNTRDLRSHLLKKMFVFMLVPMINVDGVYHGHFRMDSYGKNLNRYYSDPNPQHQPAVYAIKELAKHLAQHSRLSFYFDLHAHNAKKGAFIYGNAINDFVEQVESQVFCKLFALNHSGFEYEYCNFSIKQMNSKDKNEERTKQGCGRVVMHRLANIIHSYSLQCGIICATKQPPLPQPMNTDFALGTHSLQTQVPKRHSSEPQMFTTQSYRQLGKALLISILDVFDKNPYNRVYNSQHKSMELLRRVTAFEVFHEAERFRMFEKYVYGKVKNINQLIRDVLNSKLHYRELYNFYFYNDIQLKNCLWPDNIPGLAKPKPHNRLKRFRSLQEPKLDYSLSFIQDLKANRDLLEQPPQTPAIVYQEQYTFEGVDQDNCSSETDNQEELKRAPPENYSQIIEERTTHSEALIALEKPEAEEDLSSWQTCKEEPIDPWLGRQICSSDHDSAGEDDSPSKYNQQQLTIFQNTQQIECSELRLPNNESPSMRVRRLLKNQHPKKQSKISHLDMRGKLSDMIANSPQICHNSFISNPTHHNAFSAKLEREKPEGQPQDRQLRLFEEIKLEIREELRRHKERIGMVCTGAKGSNKPIKYSVSEVKERERVRSTNLNFLNLNLNVAHHKQKSETLQRVPSKSLVAKTQLPALNSHVLIITTNSSKGLTHLQ